MAIAPARFFSYANVFAGSPAPSLLEQSLFDFIAHALPRLDLRSTVFSLEITQKLAAAYNDTYGMACDIADAVGQMRDTRCTLCGQDLWERDTLWQVPDGPQGPEFRHPACGFDVSALAQHIDNMLLRVVQDRVRLRHPGFGPSLADLLGMQRMSQAAQQYANERYAEYDSTFWTLRRPWLVPEGAKCTDGHPSPAN